MTLTATEQLGISRASLNKEALSPSMLTRGTVDLSKSDVFRATLSAARSTFSGQKVDSMEDVVRRAAEELVAQAFIQPLLSMMHDDPLKSGLFGNTPGEKAFRPLLDAELSKRTVGGMKNDIVEALVRRLLKPGQRDQAQPSDAPEAASSVKKPEVAGETSVNVPHAAMKAVESKVDLHG